MDDWQPISTAPQFVPVMTKIDDGELSRNEQVLVLDSRLWWFVGKAMYVYYQPTHWRRATDAEVADASR